MYAQYLLEMMLTPVNTVAPSKFVTPSFSVKTHAENLGRADNLFASWRILFGTEFEGTY